MSILSGKDSWILKKALQNHCADLVNLSETFISLFIKI